MWSWIRFFLLLAACITLSLAIRHQTSVIAIQEFEIASSRRSPTSVAGRKLPSDEELRRDVQINEAIITDHGIPLTSTRFRPEIRKSRTDPSLYFQDEAVRQFCVAIGNDDVASMQKALQSGVDVNSVGDGGVTPLLWALEKRKIEAFRWLLNHGANPNATVSDIVNAGGSYASPGDTILSISVGNTWGGPLTEFFHVAMRFSKDVNQRDQHGDTLLMTYVRRILLSDSEHGFVIVKDSLRSMIDKGIDINAKNIEGTTACLLALERDNGELCAWLIEQGADPYIRNQFGKHVLDVLAERIELNSQERLKESYAKVKAALSKLDETSAETERSKSGSGSPGDTK